jgi:anti-sigma regulatory factor (Ser/Thr protein kinase)
LRNYPSTKHLAILGCQQIRGNIEKSPAHVLAARLSMNVEAPDLSAQVLADQCHLTLPSLAHWIEPAVDFLCRRAVSAGVCTEPRVAKLTVALHEALTNAVIHGNLGISSTLKEDGNHAFAEALAQRSADASLARRRVDVQMDYDGQRCRWVITDQGDGFDVDKVLARVLSDDPEVLLASGRGILLMKSFLDEVNYELGGRRLVLTLNRPTGEEKRRHDRLDLHQPLRIAPVLADGSVDWDAAYEAVSRNLSEGGVAVLTERLAQTDRVLIGLQLHNRMVYLPAEIKHCRSLAGDLIELGCNFAAPRKTETATSPTADERALHEAIARLLRKRKRGRPRTDERRRHQRISYNEQIQVIASGRRRVAGFARDLSKSGMAFITTQPLPLDDIRVVLPQKKAQPLQMRCRVVRCDRIRDDLFDVGVRFLHVAQPPG